MKRSNRWLIGLLSAVITFGALTALAGPARWRYGWRHGYHHYHGCYRDDAQQQQPFNQ